MTRSKIRNFTWERYSRTKTVPSPDTGRIHIDADKNGLRQEGLRYGA